MPSNDQTGLARRSGKVCIKDVRPVMTEGDAMLSGMRVGQVLLEGGNRPTAIVAANDMMAFGVIEAARQAGIEVPSRLSVAGFDDVPGERFPALTTVHQPVVEMAERGAQLLVKWLSSGDAPGRRERLPVTVKVRESTGPVWRAQQHG